MPLLIVMKVDTSGNIIRRFSETNTRKVEYKHAYDEEMRKREEKQIRDFRCQREIIAKRKRKELRLVMF